MGRALLLLRQVANNYIPPVWASPEYQQLLKLLFEIELDLHIHMHLENNVLLSRFGH